jgi:NAD(P)-dependent dehydrogenase (short-subunit alcohol dehydrogenase family)
LAAELSALAPAFVEAVDLAEVEAVEPAVGRVVARLGAPGLIVNNAGYGEYKPFLDHSAADHERLMNVNYFAPVRVIRAALPFMLSAGRGHVINISSMSVKMGPWGHAGYAAAKSALRSLTQTLAAEHAGSGVRFSVVYPGIVDTPYFANGEYPKLMARVRRHAIQPERVARAVVGLIDRPRLEMCVPGHYRALEFIAAISPSLAHRMVARQSGPGRGG